MPKALIPVGYSKVVAVGSYGPTTWANVFYVDTSPSDPGAPGDAMAAAAASIHAFYEAIHNIGITSAWHLEETRVVFRADPTSLYRATIADAIAGTDTGGSQDAQVAYLINWSSADPRRGGKPRQYINGVPDAVLADSARISSGSRGDWNTAIATWLASFPYTSGPDGHAVGLVEMSFVNNKAFIDPPIARPIVAGSLSPVVATQRRRVDRLRA